MRGMINAGATTRRLPRALGQMGRQKYNCVVQKVTNVHQVKVNEHDESEWNTRCRSLEDIGTALFQVCSRRVNIFRIDFNFTPTR